MSRMILGVVVLFVACQSPTSDDAGFDAGTQASTDGGIDAGAPAPGTPGAPVWYPTTVKLQISESWHFDMPLPDGTSGSICISVQREELSADQTTYLDELRLKPFETGCSADGWSYDQINVFDIDGGVAVYRSSGCPGFALPDAGALIPYGVINRFMDAGTSCP